MRLVPAMLSLSLMACGTNNPAEPSNAAIRASLKPGMTEHQVAQAMSKRVPDRVAELKCGVQTSDPFPCKAYIFDFNLRAGAKLTVVFERERGQWVVSQWF
jgi:hypothetical protein